jgi:hypothetical protein
MSNGKLRERDGVDSDTNGEDEKTDGTAVRPRRIVSAAAVQCTSRASHLQYVRRVVPPHHCTSVPTPCPLMPSPPDHPDPPSPINSY